MTGFNARFGSRYGSRIRKKVTNIEGKYKFKKQDCPFCDSKATVVRLSSGIYECNKCSKKFAGGSYEVSTDYKKTLSKYFDKYGNLNKKVDLAQAVQGN